MPSTLARVMSLLFDSRLTLGLILALVALFILGVLLPQKTRMAPREHASWAARHPVAAGIADSTGFDDVFHSTVGAVLLWAVAVQTVAFLVVAAPKRFREALRGTGRPPDALAHRDEIPAPPEAADALAEIAASRRFLVRRTDGGGLRAVRNRFSPIGTLAFHASLALLLLGGWISRASEFQGRFALCEGERFDGAPADYMGFSPVNLGPGDFPDLSLLLHKVSPLADDEGAAIQLECELETGSGPEAVRTRVRINRPLVVDATAVLPLGYGLAPLVAATETESGKATDVTCPKLNVWNEGAPEDSFRILQPPATVKVRFFPDFVETSEGPSTRSRRMTDPVLRVHVLPDELAVPPARALLRPGESVDFGPYRLTVQELRRWAMFHASREKGEPLFVAGMVVLLAGLVLRLLFPRRFFSVDVSESGDTLLVGGGGDGGGPAFHAEFGRILGAFRDRLGKPGTKNGGGE